MEKYEESLIKAQHHFKLADHIMTQTYPLVNDSKLLMTSLENMFLALTNSIAALLYLEIEDKEISSFQDNFESKFRLFEKICVPKRKLSHEYADMILEIKNIVVNRKKSPVEFSRKGSYVICSDDYKMKTISMAQLKKYLARTKSFINQISLIAGNNKGKKWKK